MILLKLILKILLFPFLLIWGLIFPNASMGSVESLKSNLRDTYSINVRATDHKTAMAKTLHTFCRLSGVAVQNRYGDFHAPSSESHFYAELLPFTFCDSSIGREGLINYLSWLAYRDSSQIDYAVIKEAVNESIAHILDDLNNPELLASAQVNQPRWMDFADRDLSQILDAKQSRSTSKNKKRKKPSTT